jgi:hypothetical protein
VLNHKRTSTSRSDVCEGVQVLLGNSVLGIDPKCLLNSVRARPKVGKSGGTPLPRYFTFCPRNFKM